MATKNMAEKIKLVKLGLSPSKKFVLLASMKAL